MRPLSFSVTDFFLEQGPFAMQMPGYTVRAAQVELAQAIEQTIAKHGVLVAEAGTGTGKTWAYLVPALISSGKTIISTGTRTLQDQLYKKDLPAVRKALGVPVNAVLLKGRLNYVCRYYLERLLDDERGLRSKHEINYLKHIKIFAQASATGDKADCISVPEAADIWNRVTSTRENCLGQDCVYRKDCFVFKARENAQNADVVVINHALFFSDLVLQADGVQSLLPEANAVIFDEAHQLPEVATRFLGDVISSQKIMEWLRAVLVALRVYVKETPTLWQSAHKEVEAKVAELRLQLRPLENMAGRRVVFDLIPDCERFINYYDALMQSVLNLTLILRKVQDKHKDLEVCAKQGAEIYESLMRWAQEVPAPEILPTVESVEGSVQQEQAVQELSRETQKFSQTTAFVRWVELTSNHIRFLRAPLSVQHFGMFKRADQAWIFTSATLSVFRDFSHFTHALGLFDAQIMQWESPFNYAEKALLYVPDHLPLPSDYSFNREFVNTLMPLIYGTNGGVLVLCTSLRAVDQIYELLLTCLDDYMLDRPLLKQGENTRTFLMQRFREHGNAILVGSASFWEGVDFPGDLLTLVAIDKLPFVPPDDPVLEARIKECEQRGGRPFFEFQIPIAAITLKQGAGRLIRSENDSGILVIGDGRLVDKSYGKLLWRGLPPFKRTRSLQQAVAFCEQISSKTKTKVK